MMEAVSGSVSGQNFGAVPATRTVRPARFMVQQAANGWTVEVQSEMGCVMYIARDVPALVALLSAIAEMCAETEVTL